VQVRRDRGFLIISARFTYDGGHFCSGSFGNSTGAVLETSVLHTRAHNFSGCGASIAPSVRLAPPAEDAAVTASAKAVLGSYPRPWRPYPES
jgi:hypothetical protein